MDYATVIGLTAAALTVIAFFPQLLKAWKTKSTRDISLGMFSAFCVGVLLWFVYGILTNDLPVTIANLLTFIQAFVILMFKLKYK
jgi:MtN3 and saliva related transmembrane protein